MEWVVSITIQYIVDFNNNILILSNTDLSKLKL